MRRLWWAGLALALGCAGFAQDNSVTLNIDARDASRRILHGRMTLPVTPGPLTLRYAKWIPGEHMPSGPITDFVGLKIMANGQPVPWRRDDVEMFAFHVEVPQGANALEIAYDFLTPSEGAFSAGASTTTELAVLNWNQFLLYPERQDSEHMTYKATLTLPDGWKFGTALPIERETGNVVVFRPAPLNTLVDSPVSAGRHYKTFELGTDMGAAHYIHVAADSEHALEATPDTVAHWKNVVTETGALFGARHYRSYHFLFTLSDHVARFGLEHHESSDDRDFERTLVDPQLTKNDATLLPHEMTHSWNGKYRRPAGLVTGGYDAPMKGDLLWVYEGLTNYLGEVIAARSGLYTQEEYRDQLAMTAASLDREYGRQWRPLEDTAVAAQLLYTAPGDFALYRRSTDYYPEGSLIWLDADVTIRRMSNGKKSLNDFCRAFHGGQGGEPALKPYTFEDVVAGLNAVQPYDWAGFLKQRLNSLDAHAPLGGITNGGYKLVYTNTASDLWHAKEAAGKSVDESYSIGLIVREEDGTIADVPLNGLAGKAGVTPGAKLIAVNGRQFTGVVLREMVHDSDHASGPFELLVKQGEFFKTYKLDYHGGSQYPHLQRDGSAKDWISEVSAPLVKRDK